MRLGIYGGSFDPIHWGHLLLAECCRETRQLDRVDFVPAAVSPHKLHTEPASPTARLEMVQLAVGGHPDFRVSSLEIDRGGVSYTVDTISAIADQHPETDLFLLMGADTLADFPHWKSPERICELCRLLVVQRPGSEGVCFEPLRGLISDERLREFEALVVRMPQIDLSSTEIRERVHAGRSIRYQTTRPVEEYIRAQGLYVDS